MILFDPGSYFKQAVGVLSANVIDPLFYRIIDVGKINKLAL